MAPYSLMTLDELEREIESVRTRQAALTEREAMLRTDRYELAQERDALHMEWESEHRRQQRADERTASVLAEQGADAVSAAIDAPPSSATGGGGN